MPESRKQGARFLCSGCDALTYAEAYSERLKERLCLPCLEEWYALDAKATAALYPKREERATRGKERR